MKRIIPALLLCIVTAAQAQIPAPGSGQPSVVSTWLFPDSLDVHYPYLYVYQDGSFEMDNYVEYHEKGDSNIFGQWSLSADTLTLHFEECMCCQFEDGEKVSMPFFGADSTHMEVTLWNKRVKLQRVNEALTPPSDGR